MSQTDPNPASDTYPLRAAARLTGISPELLRAWERRHRVVIPARSAGGSRRYSSADIEHLRRVKAAVDGGHRIGRVAKLSVEQIEALSSPSKPQPTEPMAEILSSIEHLDAALCQRLLAVQFSALGPALFSRRVALPLLHEIGERWSKNTLGIAQEHLISSTLRSVLGAALIPNPASLGGPPIVFATPSGERHEIGLLVAAIAALSAGASPLYLGTEMPAEDLISAAKQTRAHVVALSIVSLSSNQANSAINCLRRGLPDRVAIWLGGAGSQALTLPPLVEQVHSIDDLEQRVTLLEYASTP